MAERKWRNSNTRRIRRRNLTLKVKSPTRKEQHDECIKKELCIRKALKEGKKEGKELQKQSKKRNTSFLGAVKELLSIKPTADRNLVSGGMSLILSFFLKAVSLILFALIVITIILFYLYLRAFHLAFPDLISAISCVSVIAFIFFCFGVMIYAAAQEILYEKDRNYIADVFSGITGFVALVIALIALLHELSSKG